VFSPVLPQFFDERRGEAWSHLFFFRSFLEVADDVIHDLSSPFVFPFHTLCYGRPMSLRFWFAFFFPNF